MKMRPLVIVLATLLCFFVGSSAQAMYHTGLGRFMQRDPLGQTQEPDHPDVPMQMTMQNFIQRDPPVKHTLHAQLAISTDLSHNNKTSPDNMRLPHIQYTDGMNLYQYIGSKPIIFLDPTGLAWVDTGVKFCRTSSIFGHAYVEVDGVGYGFYAVSHMPGGGSWDHFNGVISNRDAGYPGATCYRVELDDACMCDAKKYHGIVKDFVTSQYNTYNMGTINRLTYLAIGNNCFDWAKGVTSRAANEACSGRRIGHTRYVP